MIGTGPLLYKDERVSAYRVNFSSKSPPHVHQESAEIAVVIGKRLPRDFPRQTSIPLPTLAERLGWNKQKKKTVSSTHQ